MFIGGGLPGGSPGPNATGSWKTIIVVFAISLCVAGFLFWLIVHVDDYL